MMIENTVQLISLIVLLMAATGIGLLLGFGRGQAAQISSRRSECYYRDLRKIDEQERQHLLDDKAAELARAELLRRTVAETAEKPVPWSILKDRRRFYFILMLAGLMSSGAIGVFVGKDQATVASIPAAMALSGSSVLTGLPTGSAASSSVADSAAIADSNDEFNKLKSYVSTLGAGANGDSRLKFPGLLIRTAGTRNMSTAPSVPDVETMISRLAQRLQAKPDDREGWRMLGWSYYNTQRFAKAVDAYQHALKLDPGSVKLQAALAAARRKAGQPALAGKSKAEAEVKSQAQAKDKAQAKVKVKTQTRPQDKTDSSRASEAGPMRGPTAQDIKDSRNMSAPARLAMITGMVDRLAARLKTAPHDADGWQRLIRSRVVLGDKQAARQALHRALAVFSTEPQVRARIVAAAKKLGVQPPD